METKTKDDIRKAVRESYGKVARAGGVSSESASGTSCCNLTQINPKPDGLSCCGSSCASAEGISQLLGYTKEDLANVPEGANLGLWCLSM